MRLNGKAEIMVHLGRSPRNRAGWRKVRREYAAALRYLSQANRVWARTEDIDALDLARSLTVTEALEVKRKAVGGGAGAPGRRTPELLILSRQIFPGMVKGKRG